MPVDGWRSVLGRIRDSLIMLNDVKADISVLVMKRNRSPSALLQVGGGSNASLSDVLVEDNACGPEALGTTIGAEIRSCGILVNDAAMTLSSGVFRRNKIGIGTTTMTGYGGAILVRSDEPASITHCVFEHNVAPSGGAVVLNSGFLNATLSNCTFRNNSALPVTPSVQVTLPSFGQGGALAIFAGGVSAVLIDGCTFENNFATTAGAAFSSAAVGAVSFHNCTFRHNTARLSGGAITGIGSGSISASLFEHNAANWTGGAAALLSSAHTVINTVFRENTVSAWHRFERLLYLILSSPSCLRVYLAGSGRWRCCYHQRHYFGP